jgi:N-acetylmuramic acid 6-phosphate (MurNAc-6-P) etherase
MSQYGAMKEAAESLLAQSNSQCKIAMIRLKNVKKFKTKTEFKKQTNMLVKGSNLRSVD